jgi:outer membrane murein-binding lipoprotein Lpp
VTETARRLGRLGRPHARGRAAAVALAGTGIALLCAAAGLALAPRLAGIAAAWVAIALAVATAVWLGRRARRAAAPTIVAGLVERAAGARAGSVAGLVGDRSTSGTSGTSVTLLDAADARAARAVADAAPAVTRALRRGTWRRLVVGAAAAVVGAAVFVAAAPASGRAAAFWHPLRALRDARAPVRLTVDRSAVRRGETVTVAIEVPGAGRAVLWTRTPGEPWGATAILLDSTGRAATRLGPLQADLHLRAASGRRSSPERHVTVALPAFLADLAITARFPEYLARADEPLIPGPDTVHLPVGTTVVTRGAASVALAGVEWRGRSGNAVQLRVDGATFDGRFAVGGGSGVQDWSLTARPADGGVLEGASPELHLRSVPDSAPVVAVPIPGRDTTLPLSLRLPLVIDVRDDYGLSRVAIVSRRISQTGRIGEAVRESLDVQGVGDRAILQGELSLERRGLLPGDTIRFHVEAFDNAPAPAGGPHRGVSAEYALRLLSREELRAAAREATRDVAAAADSVAAAQRELGDRTRDLAQERSRDATPTPAAPSGTPGRPAPPPTGALPFQATQKAEEISQQQAELQARVQELSRAVEEIARAVQAAGIDDTAFQARLREVQQLLQRAVTPELEERLAQLQEALARLDPDATRQALQRLAEAQQQLKEELERSRELFRRAALEGELTSLAADARDLQEEQREWNQEDARRADSAAAAHERALAARADSLRSGLERVSRELGADTPSDSAGGGARMSLTRDAAERAREAMGRAAAAAQAGDPQEAGEQGEEAAEALAQLPQQLLEQRDAAAEQWRREALASLDRAMSETADLAERQQEVAQALRQGDGGSGTRGRQASVEEGVRAVERQIQEAAGKHALVPPQLQAALGFAERQMRASREQLEQANPNTQAAEALAAEALDALNATAHALARSRAAVAGAKSGSGFAEAMEELARLAGRQGGLNGDAQGLMPMLGQGGQAIAQQLRALAARQRALAEQLERMRAEGTSPTAGALAQEARELARQLEAGRLDRATIERQERLYRRLLDAGRTLSGAEPDQERERTSRSATGDQVSIPPALRAGATGSGPRVRYPTWQELSALSPEQRRLVLEYFRLLNAPRP